MNTDLMFSSKTDLWATPQDFFDKLNQEFDFNLDVCALPENAKCKNYYSPEVDGLSQRWGDVYGVMLLPARTDTKWFHSYVYNKAEIRFVKGRLKFGNSKNSAPFPSMVVVFKQNKEERGEKI